MQKIMFNDRYALTQAVIEGRKTMTRRVEKWCGYIPDMIQCGHNRIEIKFGREVRFHNDSINAYLKYKPRYKVGEIVAVAQNYNEVTREFPHLKTTLVGHDVMGSETASRNKMFVSANLMPHQIRITGIRCERLQDISDEDCMNEGVMRLPDFGNMKCALPFYSGASSNQGGFYKTPREAFASLIDKVSGRGTWERNPWVVVYEFELVK